MNLKSRGNEEDGEIVLNDNEKSIGSIRFGKNEAFGGIGTSADRSIYKL
jgi:hypothetical protein